MPKPIKPNNYGVQNSIPQAIHEYGAGTALTQLLRCAPSPSDSACLGFVCTAAKICLEAAFAVIPDLNAQAQALLTDVRALEAICRKVYVEREVVDAIDTLDGRKTKFIGWTTLAFLGSSKLPTTSSRLAACGVELALKWISTDKKLLADAHMQQLSSGQLDFDLSTEEVIKAIHFESMGLADVLPWFIRTKNQYFKFLAAFSKNPPPLPQPPTVHERAMAQWRARSAYPKFKERAGVLDKTSASELQLEIVADVDFVGNFSSKQECRAALWFTAFTGLSFDVIPDIPLYLPVAGSWAICLDLDVGILKRDFACLSLSANVTLALRNCVPASAVVSIPLPEDIWRWLLSQRETFPNAALLSDLIPRLLEIQSIDKIYPSNQNMPLSWARWARTGGRVMLQVGIDNMLTSTITGNFGFTALSKFHYCAVSPTEIWDACKIIFKRLGFSVPIPMPDNLLHFGTGLVPTTEYITDCDRKNLSYLTVVRRMGKCNLSDLIAFHNQFVKCIGFRIACLLALRQANPICITASIDFDEDASIDIDDKSTAGRPGGLPVPMSDFVKETIKLYLAHCGALLKRLTKIRGAGLISNWIKKVLAGDEDTYLLCQIDQKRLVTTPLATHHIQHVHSDLAKDFGRKVMENQLRLVNHMTRDIDRFMRHEVLGQEAYTTVNDDCEQDWIERLLPSLEVIGSKLFPDLLYGLRSAP